MMSDPVDMIKELCQVMYSRGHHAPKAIEDAIIKLSPGLQQESIFTERIHLCAMLAICEGRIKEQADETKNK